MIRITLIACLLCFLRQVKYVASLEREMTISIQPGKEECFYQDVKRDQIIDLEYQVIDGGQGEIDITFHLATPSGRIIVRDLKKPENSHRTVAAEDGDYRLCWDNTFSHFNSKTVFFEIMVENREDEKDPWDGDVEFDSYDGYSPSELYDMKIQDIQDSISRVRGHLNKVRHLQDMVRAHEARDRNIAEGNFVRVNMWSMVQIAVMMAVGLTQVVMLRSLFDDRSRVHRLWKHRFSS